MRFLITRSREVDTFNWIAVDCLCWTNVTERDKIEMYIRDRKSYSFFFLCCTYTLMTFHIASLCVPSFHLGMWMSSNIPVYNSCITCLTIIDAMQWHEIHIFQYSLGWMICIT